MNSNPPTFNSSFSKRMCYTSLLLKRNRKLKWRKQLSDMRIFLGVSPHWREKSCTASSFPLFKDLKKNYHLNSMINKISYVKPNLSVSPWVLIYRWKSFTKMGIKKRNIPIISNQGAASNELFKEYFDLLRIFLKVFLHKDKSPMVTAITCDFSLAILIGNITCFSISLYCF